MNLRMGSVPGVLGGGVLSADDYTAFVGAEYLASYLPLGGGSVKLAVAGDAEVADHFASSLRSVAEREGCQMISVSAETTRVQMVDQLFFAVAREIDWRQIAAAIVTASYDAIALPASAGRLTVAEVAADQDLDPRELYRSVRRHLERTLLTDTRLPVELRRGLLRLAQAELGSGDVNAEEARVVLEWLTGEPVALRDLRAAMIHSRIGRHNARAMLVSVGHLLQLTGRGGVVVHIDLARLAEARRPPLPERNGLYYTSMAVMDTYELVRQLIDAMVDLVGMFVVAVVPPELVSDERRGLPSYTALQLRVSDEVRDRRRANPFASLVRLDVRLEAVR
jgi:bacteriophage exclusion system BrxC/D-like protein